MIGRALVVWFGFVGVAIGNGLLREELLVPRLGDARAHVASTLLLCLLIVVGTWGTVRWIGVRSRGEALAVGSLWLALTLAFEFLFGHYVAGKTWFELLADYDLAAGRVWVLVLVALVAAPLALVSRRRRS